MRSVWLVLVADMEFCSPPRLGFGINAFIRLPACLVLLAARITVAANNAGRVTGRITDPLGAAVSGAQIKATDQRNITVCETRTDPQGYFACSGISAGQFTVTASAPRFTP